MIGIYHYIAFVMFAAFCILDGLAHARAFPKIDRWKIKGAAFTALYFAIATYAPLMWDEFLGQYQLFNAAALPYWAQIVIGFFVIEALIYAWHRTMHNVQPLWRWFHQMHHSAERVDIWGAFYFHPFDMIGWALLGSFALVLGVGLTPEAAIAVAVLSTFCTMFQHTNIKTPQWLGYLITRPESHSVHHQRGHHAHNYGDIPIFDILLGTFRNPKSWDGQAGFFEGSSKQVGPMLIGREIA